MTKPIEAIRTVYKGVQMRSRAEADAARLLDLLKIEWQYEATSVLLPDGTHYWPDFLLPSRHKGHAPSWLEVRGHFSESADQQIRSAARAVAEGKVECFVFATITTSHDRIIPNCALRMGGDSMYKAILSAIWSFDVCLSCGHARALPISSSLGCDSCHQDHGKIHLHAFLVDGYLSVSDSARPGDGIRVRDLPESPSWQTLFDAPRERRSAAPVAAQRSSYGSPWKPRPRASAPEWRSNHAVANATEDPAERALVAAMLFDRSIAHAISMKHPPATFRDAHLRELYSVLLVASSTEGLDSIADRIDAETAEVLRSLLHKQDSQLPDAIDVRLNLAKLEVRNIDARLLDIRQEMQDAESRQDVERIEALGREQRQLAKERSALLPVRRPQPKLVRGPDDY